MSAKANFQASDFAVVDLMTSFGQLRIGYLSSRGKKGRQLTASTNVNTRPFVARRVRGR